MVIDWDLLAQEYHAEYVNAMEAQGVGVDEWELLEETEQEAIRRALRHICLFGGQPLGAAE